MAQAKDFPFAYFFSVLLRLMRLPSDTSIGRGCLSTVPHFCLASWSGKESFVTVKIRDASSVSTVRLGNVSPSVLCHRKGVVILRSTEGMNTFSFLPIMKCRHYIYLHSLHLLFSILGAHVRGYQMQITTNINEYATLHSKYKLNRVCSHNCCKMLVIFTHG